MEIRALTRKVFTVSRRIRAVTVVGAPLLSMGPEYRELCRTADFSLQSGKADS